MEKALPCCGCGAQARPNQRYCRNCHKEAQKKYRMKRREALLALLALRNSPIGKTEAG
jgi:uncharacterized OB-fold protein